MAFPQRCSLDVSLRLLAQCNALLKEIGVLLNAFDHGHPHTTVLLLLFLLHNNICQPANNTQADERKDDVFISHTALECLVCAKQHHGAEGTAGNKTGNNPCP